MSLIGPVLRLDRLLRAWRTVRGAVLARPAVARRSLAGRGQRSLVWGLAAFAVLQLGLALAIPHLWPVVRDPYYVFKQQALQRLVWDAEPAQQVIVMLGSSRTSFGLRAGDLGGQLSADLGRPVVAFNFGIPGAGPVMNLLHLRRLLDDGIRPNLLLVEVLPPLFSCTVAPSPEQRWLPASRLWANEIELLAGLGIPVDEQRSDWWQGLPLPWHAHRFAIVSTLAPSWLPWNLRQDWARGNDSHGWSAPLGTSSCAQKHQQDLQRTQTEYACHLKPFRLGAAPCAAQRQLLELCRQERIPVALVLMPEGPAFRSWYSTAARRQIDSMLQQLAGEFRVPIIDAREWMDEDAFSDSHHLRLAGAIAYTDRLARQEVARLLRLGGPPDSGLAWEGAACATSDR